MIDKAPTNSDINNATPHRTNMATSYAHPTRVGSIRHPQSHNQYTTVTTQPPETTSTPLPRRRKGKLRNKQHQKTGTTKTSKYQSIVYTPWYTHQIGKTDPKRKYTNTTLPTPYRALSLHELRRIRETRAEIVARKTKQNAEPHMGTLHKHPPQIVTEKLTT